MRVRVTVEVDIADGGAEPADLLESLCARARMQRGVKVTGAYVKEVDDDIATWLSRKFDPAQAG